MEAGNKTQKLEEERKKKRLKTAGREGNKEETIVGNQTLQKHNISTSHFVLFLELIYDHT